MSIEQLAKEIIRVLDVKARQGVRKPEETWTGFENGNGEEIGRDIEQLIAKAKKVTESTAQKAGE